MTLSINDKRELLAAMRAGQMHLIVERIESDTGKIIELQALVDRLQCDIDNAVRETKEMHPDYPWADDSSCRASQVAWCANESYKGISEACTDLHAEIKRLQAIVDQIPGEAILDGCKRIMSAERLALATNGPVPKTSRVMGISDLEYCLQVLWNCRSIAEVAKGKLKDDTF